MAAVKAPCPGCSSDHPEGRYCFPHTLVTPSTVRCLACGAEFVRPGWEGMDDEVRARAEQHSAECPCPWCYAEAYRRGEV